MVGANASVVKMPALDSLVAAPLSPGRVSPKNSSPRRQAFAARELDPLLANLSPLATLEALKVSNAVDSSADSKHRLLTDSIADVSPSERALGIRAAVAAKKLREWYHEVKKWQWPSRQFEPPSLRQSQVKSHNGSIGQALSSDQFVDDRYDMSYWGSLPAQTVQEHEDRLEEIQDGLEALELEDLKSYIRKAHLSTSRGSEASLHALYNSDSSSSGYNRLDDFTVVITATIMQALPYLSRLGSLIEMWQTRLIVLRQVPVFLHQLEDAQTVLTSAKTAISASSSSDLTRDSYQTMKDVLNSRTNALAQTLDNMLDVLEGRGDTIPDHWIDEMEEVERGYQNWVVDAEQVIMANELDELRSLKVDSPSSGCIPVIQLPEVFRREVSSRRTSQSEATAVEEEQPLQKQSKTPTKSAKRVPEGIDLSRLSGWAETEAIKIEAARQISRRSSFSYSEISEEPEVVQTTQVQFVDLSPTALSPGMKPSIVEISSRSSKRSSQHSTGSSGAVSPALTRTGSCSTQDSHESLYDQEERSELGVSGPPAVLAPWPPTRGTSRSQSRTKSGNIRVYETYYGSSDSEDEGGLRSYASLGPLTNQGQVSFADAHSKSQNNAAAGNTSGPSISFDDFFDSIIQPLSGNSPQTPYMSDLHLAEKISNSRLNVPSRTSSKNVKSRSKASSRAVSQHQHDLESQLNSRISNLLSRIPAPIHFFAALEEDAEERSAQHRAASLNRRSKSATHVSSTLPALRPAPARHSPLHISSCSARATHSEVRLYHLHQPGQARPIKLYVRLVGENRERVMVRVGGGWSDLGEYLHEYAAHHGRRATITGGASPQLRDSPLPAKMKLRETISRTQARARPIGRHFSVGSTTSIPDYGTMPASSGATQQATGLTISKSRRPVTPPGTTTPLRSCDMSSFALGPAGPAAKPKSISPRKRAWVNGIMNQARKVSIESTKPESIQHPIFGKVGFQAGGQGVHTQVSARAKMKGREKYV